MPAKPSFDITMTEIARPVSAWHGSNAFDLLQSLRLGVPGVNLAKSVWNSDFDPPEDLGHPAWEISIGNRTDQNELGSHDTELRSYALF